MSDNTTDQQEKKRQDTQSKISTTAWALFFIWTGFIFLVKAGTGVALIGLGSIALSMQIIRRLMGFHLERFWLISGVASVFAGVWEMLYSQLPLVPIVLMTIGVVMLLQVTTGKELFTRKKQ